jgi:Cupin
MCWSGFASGRPYASDLDGAPDHTILLGGAVSFDDTTAALLLEYLPPCVRIGADSYRAQVLRPMLELLAAESFE